MTPQQTAQDLREAARIVTELGHAKEEFVAPSGSVCAAGAIGVATGYYRRVQVGKDLWDYSANVYSRDDAPWIRYNEAIQALAPLLPTACEDGRCEDDPATAVAMHSRNERNLRHRVYHFNDWICAGGEELAALFVQAAEKIEADLP